VDDPDAFLDSSHREDGGQATDQINRPVVQEEDWGGAVQEWGAH